MSRIVVALGGNALTRAGEAGTWEEARAHMREAVRALARIVAAGHDLVLTHGNGPQVGALLLQQEARQREVPPLPLDVLGAMTQGWIGYLILTEFSPALARLRHPRELIATVTRVEVSPRDPAFRRPTKPVGRYYDETEALLLRKRHGWVMAHDAARGGWRRLVPSPEPLRIVEGPVIRDLLESARSPRAIPVVAGGGGIPVRRGPGGAYEGVEAVIDKDRTASLLASTVGAETLAIVTDVNGASVHVHTPRERRLGHVSVSELEGFLRAGEFGEGSMAPKVEAALRFVRHGGRRAIITDAYSLGASLEGTSGTIVERN